MKPIATSHLKEKLKLKLARSNNISHVDSKNAQVKNNVKFSLKENHVDDNIQDMNNSLVLSKWYDLANNLPVIDSDVLASENAVSNITLKAQKILEKASDEFEQKSTKSSGEKEWIASALKSGTLSDRVATMTLLIQEAPLYRSVTLQKLLLMCRKKGRREAILAIDSLKDLFMNTLLPDRKLKYLQEHPLSDKRVTDQHLLFWLFEDMTKRVYFHFIQILESGSHDNLYFYKSKMIHHLFDLLLSKPEQEKNLLALLVNKLGDHDKKICSKAAFLLAQLLVRHPKMKKIVVNQVEQLAFRPQMTPRAQYYGVIFLNQLILTKQESSLAAHLIGFYFKLFEKYIHEGEVESKMMTALLTGVNRAFPFVNADDPLYDAHVDSLFKLTHLGTFNTAVQALMLLLHISGSKESVVDRFHRVLYEKLFDPKLLASSKQALFLQILMTALEKEELSLARMAAFVKRLLQISLYHSSNFACASLFYLSQLFDKKPAIFQLISSPEEADDVEHFVDVDDDSDDNNNNQNSSEKKEDLENDGATHLPTKSAAAYDGRKRDPEFANAQYSCLWELNLLSQHFHPSVRHWAQQLLRGDKIVYNGDPLEDFTLIRFLDKFVYRQPKKQKENELHGSSMMQPKRNFSKKQGEGNAGPLNAPEFAEMDESKVKEEDKFFYKYLKEKQNSGKEKKKTERDVDGDDEWDDDEVDQLIRDTIPEKITISSDDGEDIDQDDDLDADEEAFRRAMESDEEDDVYEEEAMVENEDQDDNDDIDDEDDINDDIGEDNEDEHDDEHDDDDEMDEENLLLDAIGGSEDDDERDFVNGLVSEEESEEEDNTVRNGKGKKRKQKSERSNDNQSEKGIFASADDYSHLLDSDSEQTAKTVKKSNAFKNQRAKRSKGV